MGRVTGTDSRAFFYIYSVNLFIIEPSGSGSCGHLSDNTIMGKMFLAFFILFMTIVLNSVNAQEKEVTYTYDKFGIINQYTNNMVLEVNDVLKFVKRKGNSFFIQLAHPMNPPAYSLFVSLKGYDELNEKYVYIGDAIVGIDIKEGLIYKGKCLIKSSKNLDAFLNNIGYNYEYTYSKDLSFSVYFKNMRTSKEGYIPQMPYTFVEVFPIKNKSEQEREEKLLREKRKQEWEKREFERKEKEIKRKEEEVINILSTANRQNIKEQVCTYFENKLLKDSEYWDVLAKPQKKEIKTTTDVLIHIDSLQTNIVQIDKEIINYDLDFLHRKASHYCTINGTNYYKYQNHIFYIEKVDIKTKPLEKGIYGVERKKGKLKYYQTVPKEIQEWCQSNIIKNGFQAIEYSNYDGQYTIKPITVTKDVKKTLQGKDPQKAKKTWKTLGIICGNVVLIGGAIALGAM
ncbi:hypothetical protein NXY00_07315 [Bacteroides sp. BFG-551]|nr:hypothetical protein [Bacteroides sp. BFG-551]